MSNSNRITIWLDPSATKESGCILRLYNMLVGGYTQGIHANDLEFGSAFHAYRNIYVNTLYDPAAKETFKSTSELTTIAQIKGVAAGLHYWDNTKMYVKWNKKFLDRDYLETTCNEYERHYRVNGDEYEIVSLNGKPLVELRIPYPYYVTPEGDIEFILCGTIDKLIKHRSLGYYAISDYKTTAMWKIADYFESYKLSCQMIAYKLMLRKYAELYPDSLIAEISKSNLGCVIDGIFTSSSGAKFERSAPIYYSEGQMEEFEFGLKLLIHKLVDVIRYPKHLFREGMLNGSCEKVYGPCQFAEACSASSESERQVIMDNKFTKRVYNPLSHGELK